MSKPFTDLPYKKTRGSALCLSGGGFRAALFHMGALRRLNELGVLAQINEISSVSGGSVFSAWLAHCITEYGYRQEAEPYVWPDWEQNVAAPFCKFVNKGLPLWALGWARLKPAFTWQGKQNADTAKLAQCFDALNPRTLSELPLQPRFTFCATDMVFGVNWIFRRNKAGDYQTGYLRPPADWRISQAVAASACFPVALVPMSFNIPVAKLHQEKYRKADRDKLVNNLRFCDGGLYDNMGLEPVWKSREDVLVSDGGSPFAPKMEDSFLSRIGRYYSVQSNQSRALRRRWLIANYIKKIMRGAFWGVSSAVSSYGVNPGPNSGYSEDLSRNVIGTIRTHFNSFSWAEIAVLENHGYFLADAAAQKYLAAPKGGFALLSTPLKAPNPRWMDERQVRDALDIGFWRTWL